MLKYCVIVNNFLIIYFITYSLVINNNTNNFVPVSLWILQKNINVNLQNTLMIIWDKITNKLHLTRRMGGTTYIN